MTSMPEIGHPTPNCTNRMIMDLGDFEGVNQNTIRLEFPDKNCTQKFYVYIKVLEGLYRNKWFKFLFVLPDDWPIDKPWVRIMNNIWHPNIEPLEDGGRICVSTLGREYTCASTLWNHVSSIQYLLVSPNPRDSLNPKAGNEQIQNFDAFRQHVIDLMDDMEDPDFEQKNE